MRRISFLAGLVLVLSTTGWVQAEAQKSLSRCSICRLFHSPHCVPTPPPPTPTSVPIDGGLSLLLIAGAGYGIKRIKAARGKQESV